MSANLVLLEKPPPLMCSFCGRLQDEALTLIAGPIAYICDECVDLAATIVKEKREKAALANAPDGGR